MEHYSAAEIAELASVERAYVDRLIDRGVLKPDDVGQFGPGDVRRISIVVSLERAGLPLDGIAEGLRRGSLTLAFADEPSYERFSAYGDETFRQVAARTGLPLELLVVIREAMGSAEARPDDRMRLDELSVVPLLHFMMGLGSRAPVVEGFIRVLGESLRRAAETEGDWWRSEVIPRFGERGPTEEQLAELLGDDISRSSDEALLAIYRGQQANAWLKNIFEGFASGLVAAGLHTRDERPPAMCFLDLTGYTRLTDERGDSAAADLASRLGRMVQRTSGQHGGRPVKWLGDGVMFHFREPGPAVLAALEMVESAQKEGLPPARVGLHAGPVLFREGDYFGRTVNVASRIADYARQGEVLVSQEVVDASNGQGVVFAEIGAVELKGLTETVRLHIARRSAA